MTAESTTTAARIPQQATRPAAGAATPTPGPARSPRGLPLVRAVRPRQWVKNTLVFGAPLAAGRLLEAHVLLGAAVAFVVFCAAASAIYLVNDVRDVEHDRVHPEKRHRPIAAGELSERTALVVGLSLGVLALAAAYAWAVPLGLTVTAYLAVQVGYAFGLKDQPGIDLAAVSSGFLLRAIAGGTAAGIALSPWFLLVAAFGSLFMVSGKRYSEIRRLGAASESRRSLQKYSESYLRFYWTMAAGVTVMVYILWALNGIHGNQPGPVWGPVSVAPFVLGLVRYAADIDRGTAESPEEIVLSDRHLQVIGAVWLLTLVLHATLG
jgi:decaprenyl-phosphate phosphoribosyltransferase